jgi:hypothetical protein
MSSESLTQADRFLSRVPKVQFNVEVLGSLAMQFFEKTHWKQPLREPHPTVIVRYAFEVSNGAKRKTGEAETLLVFNTLSNAPRLILVREHLGD